MNNRQKIITTALFTTILIFSVCVESAYALENEDPILLANNKAALSLFPLPQINGAIYADTDIAAQAISTMMITTPDNLDEQFRITPNQIAEHYLRFNQVRINQLGINSVKEKPFSQLERALRKANTRHQNRISLEGIGHAKHNNRIKLENTQTIFQFRSL
ncbi:MAG: hypothetical protein JKY67_08275 [Pseudomonadales bacterium]|nr:hypothetical protein [Pseudomonadales bacterium]